MRREFKRLSDERTQRRRFSNVHHETFMKCVSPSVHTYAQKIFLSPPIAPFISLKQLETERCHLHYAGNGKATFSLWVRR